MYLDVFFIVHVRRYVKKTKNNVHQRLLVNEHISYNGGVCLCNADANDASIPNTMGFLCAK